MGAARRDARNGLEGYRITSQRFGIPLGPGTAKKLPSSVSCPVPNMGWCATTTARSHPLMDGISDGAYFYYLHSYALPVSDDTIATAEHAEAFSAVIGKDNFTAAQFHPERSSAAGSRLLSNFLGLPT